MEQRWIAGALLAVIGVVILVFPHQLWHGLEARKKVLRLKEKTYVIVLRLLGAVLIVTGILVALLGH